MGKQMKDGGALLFSAAIPLSVSGHSNSVILIRCFPNFILYIASIKLSFKFENGFRLMNDNQDGQNITTASVFTWSL